MVSRLKSSRVPMPLRKTKRKRRPSKHRVFLNSQRHRYPELFEAQGGVCFLCGRPPKTRRLHLDHHHGTMKLRALLCFRCNSGLKHWMTKEWLLKAAEYVDREV